MPSYTKASSSWTPDRVDLLKALWKKGYSAGRIAIEFGDGTSRNAIIGKAARLGLHKRATKLRKPRVEPKTNLLTIVPGPRIEKMVKRPPIQTSKPYSTAVFVPRHDKPVPIDDLHGLSCRWPFDDADGNHLGYCGCKKTGGSYCDFHAEIAYLPMRNSKRKGEKVA